MYDHVSAELLKEYKIGELLVPVVWGYRENVNEPGYFPDGMMKRFHAAFKEIILAGAYKGASGDTMTYMNVERYMRNLKSYHTLYNISHRVGTVQRIILIFENSGTERHALWDHSDWMAALQP